MATGNEHFEQAETALTTAEGEDNWQVKAVFANLSLAHAALAQAAATAQAGGLPGYGQQP